MRIGIVRTSMIFLILTGMACKSSRYQGFNYRPSQPGPDITGSPASDSISGQQVNQEIIEINTVQNNQEHKENTSLVELTNMVEAQLETSSLEEKPDARELVFKMANTYSQEKNVQLTEKQWRKLDRYSAKLEKKQQKRAEVEWGPKNNLEIFVLAAAGVGLVVGLFSSFGWIVFLVAALVYLYLKLLKN